MAVPSNRVPVRVARGLKSALTTNLADLLEGELVYAKDEDKLYMVEGGVLVAMGADLAASSIGDLSDVALVSPATGEVLRYDGSNWVDAQLDYSDLSGTPALATVATSGSYTDLSNQPTLGTAAAANTGDFATAAQGATADSAVQPTNSIDALADVDTTTAAPTNGQVLEWNGVNWVPATIAAGGVTSIIAGTGISVDQSTGDVTVTATGGGGGGGLSGIGVATRAMDGGTPSFGDLTLTGLGSSGLLRTIGCLSDAWIVVYGSSFARSADSGRAYGTDPDPGSGVLAEVYVVASNGDVLLTPGTSYMNDDFTETSAIYLAVRDQSGNPVDSNVTITAYVQGGYTGVSGGTFGSG